MRGVWVVVLTMLMAACATHSPAPVSASASTSSASTASMASAPVLSADVIEARRLCASWKTAGLEAEERSKQISDTPVDHIEWQSLEVVLPFDPVRDDDIAAQVGGFAAAASHPVLIELFARSHKQDGELSAALKKGLVNRGGHNSVKLDHHIGVQFLPHFLVVLQGNAS